MHWRQLRRAVQRLIYSERSGPPPQTERPITRLILHASDRDPRTGEPFATERQIRDFHVNQLGWRDTGYHWVVRRDGRVEKGRPEAEQGAHVLGYNSDSIGICLCGADALFTVPQISAAVRLVRSLQKSYGLTAEDVYGHNDYTDDKVCPYFKAEEFRNLL